MKFTIIVAVHILIFGEIAGFTIDQFLTMHMKKALKYVISKYAIWKNTAHFNPVQIHGDNIEVCNKKVYCTVCINAL